jgi:predicted AlkP superfamily phosphohydrolase/phosphomutase
VLVFAVHGMGPNSGWAERCGDLLARIARGDRPEPLRRGVLFEARRALSADTRRRLRRLVPRATRNLLALLSQPRFEWSTTRFFPVDMDLAGYVRVNLKGREARGIVGDGDEYDELCHHLTTSLESFRDLATGAPIVRAVHRRDELAPEETPYRSLLPDLVVEWSGVSAVSSSGVTSPAHGDIRWPDGGRLPSGRSGNHRGEGWFVAAGPGLPTGPEDARRDIVDLVPTVLRWLDAAHPPGFQGEPIPSLCSGRLQGSAQPGGGSSNARS